MRDIESFKSARAFTAPSKPQEPPMIKANCPLPCTLWRAICCASCSEESICPSMHMAVTKLCGAIFARIACPSSFSAAAICASEGFCGTRASGSSRI